MWYLTPTKQGLGVKLWGIFSEHFGISFRTSYFREYDIFFEQTR